MDTMLPRFALAASLLISACGTAPPPRVPAPVYTPQPVLTVPSPARRPAPMICEDKSGREIPCFPR